VLAAMRRDLRVGEQPLQLARARAIEAEPDSGADQRRQKLPDSVYTGIWWYARFPNHYAGDASAANKELGEFDQKEWSRQIAEAVKAIKADDESLKLQNQFFEDAKHPLDTKQ